MYVRAPRNVIRYRSPPCVPTTGIPRRVIPVYVPSRKHEEEEEEAPVDDDVTRYDGRAC